MSNEPENDPTADAPDPTAVPGRGDDEREAREQLEQTGDLGRDALGNADGAS